MADARWMPPVVLAVGSALVFGLGPDRIQPRPLRAPLSGVTVDVPGYQSSGDLPIRDEERRVAGMDQYLYRVYSADSANQFSVYVGFYEKQYSGKAIHSPRNCLPGAGWEPLQSTVQPITVDGRTGEINRYLLQNGPNRALVLYWYQGRGRLEASEYWVKWHLLRDSAIRRRSDEALVRVLVPLAPDLTEAAADSLATRVAAQLIPQIDGALPSS